MFRALQKLENYCNVPKPNQLDLYDFLVYDNKLHYQVVRVEGDTYQYGLLNYSTMTIDVISDCISDIWEDLSNKPQMIVKGSDVTMTLRVND